MTGSARIGLAAALLLGGVTFALAQNGPATGGYPPGTKNPNLYGYYGPTLDPAMRLERPFSGIRSHTTATGLGAAGDGKCKTLA
jgi:hypothetical protein